MEAFAFKATGERTDLHRFLHCTTRDACFAENAVSGDRETPNYGGDHPLADHAEEYGSEDALNDTASFTIVPLMTGGVCLDRGYGECIFLEHGAPG